MKLCASFKLVISSFMKEPKITYSNQENNKDMVKIWLFVERAHLCKVFEG